MVNLGNLNTEQDDNVPNLEELLQIATTTLKQGNKQGAQILIRQVLESDKRNDRAWVLLALASTDPLDRQRYLRTALRLNPNNRAAQRALEKMKTARSKAESQALYYGTIAIGIAVILGIIACVVIVAL